MRWHFIRDLLVCLEHCREEIRLRKMLLEYRSVFAHLIIQRFQSVEEKIHRVGIEVLVGKAQAAVVQVFVQFSKTTKEQY